MAPAMAAREPELAQNFTIDLAVFNSGLAGVDQPANFLFAACLGITLAALCGFTLIYRWIHIWHAHARRVITLSNPDKQRYWDRNHTSWWPWAKRHIFVAPLFKTRHNRQLQLTASLGAGSIPSRFQTILLAVYILSNIAYCLVLDYSPKVAAPILAALRGRTGELATINLIPTILFALRNNPLIPLLNVPYDTFNLFHRWCARVVVVEALLHTMCYLINVGNGGWSAIGNSLATTSSYQWGMVATVALFIMTIQTFSPLRHAFYEVFVNLHRVLVLITIAGVYLHIERANLPQLPILRAVIAGWMLELLARAYRVVYYNVSMRLGITKVLVEALPAEACRVTFRLTTPWKPVPGAHVHVYLPAVGLWSSHPFSIAWTDTFSSLTPCRSNDDEKVADDGTPQRRLSTHKGALAGESGAVQVDVNQVPVSLCSKKQTISTVSVIMRARTGMTRSLYNKAVASPSGEIVLRGAVEGPYGGHDSLSSYGTVVLFAGGVGITHCISFVRHLLHEHAAGTASTQRLLLVWSVTNTEALEWVRPWMDEILRIEGRKEILRIQLFITKPRHQNEVISNTGTVQMFPGRCSAKAVIDKEFAERIGTMAVTVCGPGPFADNVRSATRAKMELGAVDFIEEGFSY